MTRSIKSLKLELQLQGRVKQISGLLSSIQQTFITSLLQAVSNWYQESLDILLDIVYNV